MDTLNPPPYQALGELARKIGEADFYTAMISLAASIVKSDMNIIMLYSRHSAPIYINCETVPSAVVNMYKSGYYRFDPFYHYWRQQGAPGVYSAREASPNQTITSDHFSIFLPSAGINDELGILLPTIGSSAVGLFLERHDNFLSSEKELLCALFPLLNGLHMSHQKYLLSNHTNNNEYINHLHMDNHA